MSSNPVTFRSRVNGLLVSFTENTLRQGGWPSTKLLKYSGEQGFDMSGALHFTAVGPGELHVVNQRLRYADSTLETATTYIDWGDGNGVTQYVGDGTESFTYPAGTFQGRIRFTCPAQDDDDRISNNYLGGSALTAITKYGDPAHLRTKLITNALTLPMAVSLGTSPNFVSVPTDVSPPLLATGELYLALTSATGFNQDIGFWDVSGVDQLNSMFDGATSFNQDIGGWDTSNVTTMTYMFRNANTFNQDIGGWDTSNVIHARRCFQNAYAFNQDIGNWNLQAILNSDAMEYFFKNATVFNQDLSRWCMTNAPTVPLQFSTGSAMVNENLPVWGTCP